MAERGWRREPVPYMVAVAHLLRRIESVPCREIVVQAERPDTTAVVGRPIREQSAETPAPVHKLKPNERVVKSVVSGEWVRVTLPPESA